MKRLIALLLTVSMIVTLVLPTTVFAADNGTFVVTVNGTETTEVERGDTIKCITTVPTNVSINDFQVGINFNSTYLEVTDIQSSGPSALAALTVTTNVEGANTNQFVRVSGIATSAQSATEDIVLTTTFTVKDTAPLGDISDLVSLGDCYLKDQSTSYSITWSGDTAFDAKVILPATSIDITESSTSIEVNETETLAYTVSPTTTTDTVVWSSDKESVATVDQDGKVTGVSEGTATITATAGSVSDTCTVTVTKKSQAALTLTTTEATYGTNLTLEVSGGSTNGEVSYAMAADQAGCTGTATVTTAGVLTPTQAGTVSVTATMAGDTEYEAVSVTGTVDIAEAEIAKPTVDATSFTHDGTTKTYTPVGFDADTMNISGNVQTDADTYTVTVSLKDNTNYVWADSTTEAVTFQFVIAKGAAVDGITGTKTVVSSEYDESEATDYTYDLSTLTGKADNMGTLSYEYKSVDGSMISDTPVVDGTTLNFKVVPATAGTEATITVTVSSTNYADSTATITITSKDKQDAVVSVSQDDTTYGTALVDPDASATYEDEEGDYWSYNYTSTGSYNSEEKPTAAGDYTVTATYEDDSYYGTNTADFTIAQKDITISGITAEGKTYDGGTTATLDCGSAVFTGLESGDELTVTATGTFEDKNAGEDKPVNLTELALGGEDKDNYTLAISGQQETTTATISAKEVTVSGITASDKTYDGGTTATLDCDSAVFTGRESVDALTVTATGTFADANVGEGKTVTLSELALGGTDVDNYTLATTGHQASTTATITAKTLTSAMIEDIADQTYTGDEIEPDITVTDGDPSIITSTDYSIDYSDNTNVGTATVTITATGNYKNDTPQASATFNIVKADSDIDTSLVAPTSVTYGDTLTITFTPEVDTRDASDVTTDQAELLYGTIKLDTVTKESDGSYKFEYDTSDKTLDIGDNTLTINYDGSSNLEGTSTEVTVTLVAKNISTATVEAIDAVNYTGSALEPTVAVTDLLKDEDFTVSYSNNINAGAAAVATIAGIGYYTGEVTENFTINQIAYDGDKTSTGAAKAGATGTVSLATWDVLDGVSFGEPDVDGTIVTADSITEGVLSFTMNDGATTNETADITILVSSTNYTDFTVTVTITVSALDVPVLTNADVTKTYDGIALTDTDITGTAMVGEVEVEGTWSFDNAPTITDVADGGVYAVTFTPGDGGLYATATTSSVVTIETATITITADDKTAYNGYDEPTYTYTVTGLVGEEELSKEPTTVAGVNVDMDTNGTYTIAVSEDAEASENYTIVYVAGTLTVSTKSTSSGSTSSSSGSSSSSSSSSADTTTNDDGSVTATVDSSSSTSSGVTTTTVADDDITDAIETAVDEADGETAYVEIEVTTKSTTDTVAVELSTDAISAIAESDVAALIITSDLGSVVIPTEALAAMASQASGTDIVITVAAVDTESALTAAQQAVVGDAVVFDLTVTSGDEAITSFDGYEITVIFPYELKDDESAENIVVWYIDDLGNITPMETVYDEDAQTATFKTTHFSVYAIVHDTNPFTDVDVNAYYYNPVLWAVENGITSGTSDTTFSPDATCTRAQAVTFLYRAAGEPEVTGTNPFTDVSSDAYYYNAVLWAVEMGITTGTSDTTFSPDATCARGQIVTFLYRAAGEPTVTYGTGFSDVTSDAYYYSAVLWAVNNGITNGTSDTTFSPSADCTRGQIVTFLYRNMAE